MNRTSSCWWQRSAQLHQLISSNNRYFREAAFLGFFGFFFLTLEDQLTRLFVTLLSDLMLLFRKCSCSTRKAGVDAGVTEEILWLVLQRSQVRGIRWLLPPTQGHQAWTELFCVCQILCQSQTLVSCSHPAARSYHQKQRLLFFLDSDKSFSN